MAYTQDMEQKIIEAAIACIEAFGVRGATTRRIAEKAGVNAAAINYYFRTKEQLLSQVFETTLKNAFDWDNFHIADTPPKERLAGILTELTEGALAYPEITRAHLIAPLMEGRFAEPSLAGFTEFTERLYADMAAHGAPEGEALRHGLIQAVSASILGIGMFMRLFGPVLGAGLEDREARKRYIERVAEAAF
jgi:AcrR family transcriptional regulator